MRGSFSVSGLDEWLEALRQADANVEAVAAEAVEAGGQVLLAGMLSRVPVDTGNLRDHLTVDGPHQEPNGEVWVEVGLPKKSTDAKTMRYGTVQEYGSAHTHAQPYIRPAFDSDRAKARKVMVDVLKKAMPS